MSSDAVLVDRNGKQDITANSIQTFLLRRCNTLLTTIMNQLPMESSNVEISKTERSSALNGFVTKDGLKEIFERKDCLAVDAVFHFVRAFANR